LPGGFSPTIGFQDCPELLDNCRAALAPYSDENLYPTDNPNICRAALAPYSDENLYSTDNSNICRAALAPQLDFKIVLNCWTIAGRL